jgi:hypothetical protein
VDDAEFIVRAGISVFGFCGRLLWFRGANNEANHRSRHLIAKALGGDDFPLTLEWAEEIRDLIASGAEQIVGNRSDSEVWLSSK